MATKQVLTATAGQEVMALSTSDALTLAQGDWAGRTKTTVAVAPEFESDRRARERKARSLDSLDALAIAIADPVELLKAHLTRQELYDPSVLLLLRRLSVTTIDHLALLTFQQMVDAGFNRLQARKLELIGAAAKDGRRRHTVGSPLSSPSRFERLGTSLDDVLDGRGPQYLTEAERTEKEQLHSRVYMGEELARARVDWAAREKSTVPVGPVFQKEYLRNPEKHVTGAEEIGGFFATMRRNMGLSLTKEKEAYNERERDASGKVKATFGLDFTFDPASIMPREISSSSPPPPLSTPCARTKPASGRALTACLATSSPCAWPMHAPPVRVSRRGAAEAGLRARSGQERHRGAAHIDRRLPDPNSRRGAQPPHQDR